VPREQGKLPALVIPFRLLASGPKFDDQVKYYLDGKYKKHAAYQKEKGLGKDGPVFNGL
jgi:hypothetical protein